MDEHFSQEFWTELNSQKDGTSGKRKRLRVDCAGTQYRVVDVTAKHLMIEVTGSAPSGRVELYDGAIHLGTHEIWADDMTGTIRAYRYRPLKAAVTQPPIDFVVDGWDLFT